MDLKDENVQGLQKNVSYLDSVKSIWQNVGTYTKMIFLRVVLCCKSKCIFTGHWARSEKCSFNMGGVGDRHSSRMVGG